MSALVHHGGMGPPNRLVDPRALRIQARLRAAGAISPDRAVHPTSELLDGEDYHHLHLPGVLSEADGRIWLDEPRLARERQYSALAWRWAIPAGLVLGAVFAIWLFYIISLFQGPYERPACGSGATTEARAQTCRS